MDPAETLDPYFFACHDLIWLLYKGKGKEGVWLALSKSA